METLRSSLPPAASMLPSLLLAAGGVCATNVGSTGWRVANLAKVEGNVRFAEVEFYTDAGCTKQANVSQISLTPLPKNPKFPGQNAFDGNVNSIADVECDGGCAPGTVVFGATFREPVRIRCVIVLQPTGGVYTGFTVNRTLQKKDFLHLHTLLANFTEVDCPGICRSGRYLEGISTAAPDAPCDRWLSSHGWCGEEPGHVRNGVDCHGCQGLAKISWASAPFPDVTADTRSDGLLELRLRDHGWGPFNDLAESFNLVLVSGVLLAWCGAFALLVLLCPRGLLCCGCRRRSRRGII